MAAEVTRSRRIGDLFYETRAKMGRDYTVRRFAAEVLHDRLNENLLSAIEKGTRFPTEALVRRLASVRGEDPKHLLAVLWRDRMIHAFRKELVRALRAPREIGNVEDGDLAVVISRAISSLPDDGSPMDRKKWHAAFRLAPNRQAGSVEATDELVERAEEILAARDLVAIKGSDVALRDQNYVASEVHERQALAIEFFEIFAKGLLDKLVLGDDGGDTYLRNHFIHVETERLPQLHAELHAAVAAVMKKFETDETVGDAFLNVLVDATTLGVKKS